MRVNIIDYGAGNLHSLQKALVASGASAAVESDPAACLAGDVLCLPGVGAFPHAAARIAPAREVIRAAMSNGLPTIGVCLGMQLLFEESDEGAGDGLGVLAGRVTRLAAERVPHIGWNTIEPGGTDLLVKSGLSVAYYAHGFACRPRDDSIVVAWSTHGGDRFPAIVRSRNVLGVQFHPEKSSLAGVRFLRLALAECIR
jgi:glutamine amidotransferase